MIKEGRIEDQSKKTERVPENEARGEWHPIITFVGPEKSFGPDQEIHADEFGTENVDWISARWNAKDGQRGNKFYILSRVNSLRKVAEGYYVCSGVAATGAKRSGGETVSFLTHQFPNSPYDRKFRDDFKEVLKEFMDQTDPEKRSLVVFGNQTHYLDFLRESLRAEGLKVEYIQPKADFTRGFEVKLDTPHNRLYITQK